MGHNRDIHGLLWVIFAGLLDAEIGPGSPGRIISRTVARAAAIPVFR